MARKRFLEESRVQFAEPSARPSSAALMLNSADLSRECGVLPLARPDTQEARSSTAANVFLPNSRRNYQPGLGFVVLASKGSRPVAASGFFHTKTKAVYKFGASDEKHQDLRE